MKAEAKLIRQDIIFPDSGAEGSDLVPPQGESEGGSQETEVPQE